MQERRARALLVAASLFAAIVFVTSMPVSDLLSQHSALSSTANRLASVQAQNRALRRDASQLANPATAAAIARRDYGLVAPGSQAYEILPAPGSSVAAAASTGHVPLNGPPVVPGSARSQQLLGAGDVSRAPRSFPNRSTAGRRQGRSRPTRAAAEPRAAEITPSGGFWTRVVRTFEFWR